MERENDEDAGIVSAEQVQRFFYEDWETRKIRWETASLQEIAISKVVDMPIDSMDKWELKCRYQELRQAIYRVADLEWKENGRVLVAIKLMKSQPVQYGFTRKSGELLNNFDRERQRIENKKEKYFARLSAIASKLNEEQRESLELTNNKHFVKLVGAE
jgi:hypothetical protein